MRGHNQNGIESGDEIHLLMDLPRLQIGSTKKHFSKDIQKNVLEHVKTK